MTMPSPWIIGMIDTRTSISRPLDAHLDAAVLRQALLGDVQAGHDLDAADDGRLEAVDLRRQGLGLQHAVDAVADAQAAFLRLDVDVAGALVGGLDEDLVDQLDDAGLLGHLGHFAVVGLEAFEQFDVLVALLHQGGDGLAADAEMRLDEPGDLARAGQDRLNVQAGEHVQFVEGVDVEGIAGRDDQGAVVAARAA